MAQHDVDATIALFKERDRLQLKTKELTRRASGKRTRLSPEEKAEVDRFRFGDVDFGTVEEEPE
jgi:hypothetical protein